MPCQKTRWSCKTNTSHPSGDIKLKNHIMSVQLCDDILHMLCTCYITCFITLIQITKDLKKLHQVHVEYNVIYIKQLSISRRKCSIRGELIVKINDTTDYWWVKHMFRTKVFISGSCGRCVR